MITQPRSFHGGSSWAREVPAVLPNLIAAASEVASRLGPSPNPSSILWLPLIPWSPDPISHPLKLLPSYPSPSFSPCVPIGSSPCTRLPGTGGHLCAPHLCRAGLVIPHLLMSAPALEPGQEVHLIFLKCGLHTGPTCAVSSIDGRSTL